MQINCLDFFKKNQFIPAYFAGLNYLVGTGVVYAGTSCPDKPGDSKVNGYCLTLSFNESFRFQLYFPQYGTIKIYMRQNNGGTWTEWVEK